jgi:hypothetical protein
MLTRILWGSLFEISHFDVQVETEGLPYIMITLELGYVATKAFAQKHIKWTSLSSAMLNVWSYSD